MALSRIDVIGFSVLLLPLLAPAQSQFDGTWKLKMNSAKIPKTTDVFLLQNGMYESNDSGRIKADGTDQNVTGFPDRDTMSIKVIDDYNVEVKAKRDGKVVWTEKDSISANGDTLNVSFTVSYGSGHGSGHSTSKRVAKGPAGAHLLSGSWRTIEKQIEGSPDLLTWTYKVNGNELTMTNSGGQSYTAKLDGTEAPLKGDPERATVSLKMLGKNTLEETHKAEGKIFKIWKMKVASDGESMKIVQYDKRDGTKFSGTLIKSGSAP
jgi:hypothetical protein